MRIKRRLPVLVPEEFGIGEAGPQHPLIAGKDHRVAVRIGQPVADHDKPGLQRAISASGRQIFLMRADRRLQNLVRQRHEAVLDGAEQRRWPFDKAADLIDQTLVGAQRRAGIGGQTGGTIDNGLPAFGAVDHDMTGAKTRHIFRGASDAGKVDILRALEIMAAACRCERQAGPAKVEFASKRRAGKQQIDPVKWTYPAKPRATPALALWPGELGQHATDHGRQQGGGINPRLLDPGEQKGAFRRVFLN